MLQSSDNRFGSLDAKEATQKQQQHRSKVTIKDLLTLLIGTAIPVAIGIYTAIMNQQAQKAARQQREFEIQQAKELYQQQLYKNFIDDMYVLHKDGEFNESADPWVFANARYRAAHREFDNVRKVQALRFLKERELIGRQRCTNTCARQNISDIVRLDGLVFDHLNISSDTGIFTRLNLTCIQFNRVSILNSLFLYVDLNGVVFNNSRLNGTILHGCSLNCVIIQNTSLNRTNASDSTMNGIQLINSDSSAAILSDIQKEQANLNIPTTMPTASRADHTTIEKTTISSTMMTATITSVPIVVTSSTTASISTTDPIALTNTEPSIITTTESTTITTESTTTTTKSTTTTTQSTTTNTKSAMATTESITTTIKAITVTTEPVIATTKSTTATTEPVITTTKSITTTTEPAMATTESITTTSLKRNTSLIIPNLPVNAGWAQQGETVAGGHGQGGNNNQLRWPEGLFVDDDDDQTIVIADRGNHRVMQWKSGDIQGERVAGGNGNGSRLDQLYWPTDVLIDNETNSLIIADGGRVVRWSRRSGTTQGEILIDNIRCWGLAMDEQRYLYVSDTEKHEVRRYEIDRGDKTGTAVAGGNGTGSGFNQLNGPRYLFVDRNQSLYVSDRDNHRVMKWDKDAAQGVVVAGGQGDGSALTQLSYPNGIFVDTLGTLYVAEAGNNRVTRWPQESEKKGTVLVGGNGAGSAANQFKGPVSLSFDKHGNLYVVDYFNHRVQRFNRTQ